MAFEVTQAKNDTTAHRSVVAIDVACSLASLDVVHNNKQSAKLCLAVFDKDNPFQIIARNDRPAALEPIQRPSDSAQPKQLSKELVTELESIAEALSKSGEFSSDEQLKGVEAGTIDGKDLIINRLRTALKKAIGEGKDIGPAIESMNKKLAALKSPYELKAEDYKNDGTEGYNIKLIDRNSGKEKDKFLAKTWDESQLERLAKHFSNGKFMSADERDKTISGKMRVRDTKMGELIATIQDAVALGLDPMKVVDSLNKHLANSKSSFKIEAEKDGDGIRLRLVDSGTGKSTDKIRVPFEPLWKVMNPDSFEIS